MRGRWDEREGEVACPPRREARALAELRGLYRKVDATLAPFGCARSGDCCQLSRTGRQPYLFPVELRALLNRVGCWPEPRAYGGCPFLDAAGTRCTVYADRPFGCRTWFCERISPIASGGPRRLPVDAIRALTARLTALSDEVDPGANPRPLLELAADGR